MRNSFIIWVLCLFCLNSEAQSYELISEGRDTINLIDQNQLKQGQWFLMGKHLPGTCFAQDQKAEEGYYMNNKKAGLWIVYHCNGNIKSKINYVNGRPEGPVMIFFKSGKLNEVGTWKNNHWVDDLNVYDEAGNMMLFSYDEKGNLHSKEYSKAQKPVYSDPTKK